MQPQTVLPLPREVILYQKSWLDTMEFSRWQVTDSFGDFYIITRRFLLFFRQTKVINRSDPAIFSSVYF